MKRIYRLIPIGVAAIIVFILTSAAVYAAVVTRGPYLQTGTPNSVIVRWRTDVATDSRVSYGTVLGNLTSVVDNPTVTTENEVTLSGLMANTTYYYAVGTTAGILAGNDATYFFLTSPPVGTPKQTRIWVLGDSGTGTTTLYAPQVRDAYYTYTGTRHTDLWLMLGDNAYKNGADADYQAAVFNIYPTMLRKSVLWPTLGNHDGLSATSSTQSGPYYDIFSLPKNAEAGGVASGTEAYYSYNYGNIHFIVLDSYDLSRLPSGAMMTWLANDLIASTQDWNIAYWHHPPYSKGVHNSDDTSGYEKELVEMRQYALPILDAYGVDLVLAGHSHSYERSFLLDGHYGTSTTLLPSMILNNGDGLPTGNGAYTKPALGLTPHTGAVYAVVGASGKSDGGALNHPAMFISLDVMGSMILDVDGNRLDAIYLDRPGAVRDAFTIIKGAVINTPPTATDDSAVTNEDTLVTMTVLANDTDPNNDPLTVSSVTQPSNGSAAINADNTVTYTPNLNFNGLNSFTYTISDGQGGTSTATVSITVNPINDPPIANNQSVTTPMNTAVVMTLTASDIDFDPLTYSVVSQPTNGILSGTAPSLTYTPNSGFFGSDRFTFKANDTIADSNIATVSIIVTSVPITTNYMSPTANAPVTTQAGDNNGFQTNAANAQTDNGLFAVDTNSGTGSSTSCTDTKKDKHIFYNYNFSIPSGATLLGIDVRLDAKADATSGSPKLCVQLSSDGGVTWTTAKATPKLTKNEATYLLGSASDLWSRTWTNENFSNASFRVRVISVSSSGSRDFSLDWAPVRITYKP